MSKRDKRWNSLTILESLMNWNMIDKLPVKKQSIVILFIIMVRSKLKMKTKRILNRHVKEQTNTITFPLYLVSSLKSIELLLGLNLKMTCKATWTILKVVK
jgi:hypothetical protein